MPCSYPCRSLAMRMALALGLLLVPAASAAARPPAAAPSGLVALATIVVGRHPYAVALDSAAGRLFVLDSGSYNEPPLQGSRIAVLGTASGRLLQTIPLSPTISPGNPGGYPGYLALDRRRHRLYVIEDGLQISGPRVPNAPFDVRVLDSRTGATLDRSPQQALTLAVDEASGRAFSLAMAPLPGAPYRYALLDAGSGRVLASLGGRYPAGAVVAPGSDRLYVPVAGPANCTARNPDCLNGGLLTFDTRTAGLLASSPPTHAPYAVAITYPPGRAFVGLSGPGSGHANNPSIPFTPNDRVEVLDTATGASLATISRVRITRFGVAFDANRGEAYVLAERKAGGLEVVDLRTGRTLRALPGVLNSLALPRPQGGYNPYLSAVEAVMLIADPPRHQLLGVAESFRPNPVTTAIPSTAYLEDERTGALLGQARVGTGPSALVLDPATGHAFVANADDGTITVLGLAPAP